MKPLVLSLMLCIAGFLSEVWGQDNPSTDGRPRSPIFGWETVVVSPKAEILPTAWKHSDSDAENLVERFLKILIESGVSARKATRTDERQILLTFTATLSRESPYHLRVRHRERATYERNGSLVTGLVTTWEADEFGTNDWTYSTSWPVIEKSMKALAGKLSEAIADDAGSNPAEQLSDGKPDPVSR